MQFQLSQQQAFILCKNDDDFLRLIIRRALGHETVSEALERICSENSNSSSRGFDLISCIRELRTWSIDNLGQFEADEIENGTLRLRCAKDLVEECISRINRRNGK
jgi:hypothetical protein